MRLVKVKIYSSKENYIKSDAKKKMTLLTPEKIKL